MQTLSDTTLSDLYKNHFFCHTCGTNKTQIRFVQIIGDRAKISDVESSPCNFFLVCEACYVKKINSEENLRKILMDTLLFLINVKYQMTNKDLDFYLKYKKYYHL